MSQPPRQIVLGFAGAAVIAGCISQPAHATGSPPGTIANTITAHYYAGGGPVRVNGTNQRDNLRVYQSRTAPGRLVVWSPAGSEVVATPTKGPEASRGCRQGRVSWSSALRTDLVTCPLASVALDTYGGDDLVAFDPLFPRYANINGGLGDDVLRAGNGDPDTREAHYVNGSWGNDTIIGSRQDDYLFGGDDEFAAEGRAEDNDLIYGAAGDDQLFGDEDDDSLWGGGGDDRLYDDARPPIRQQLQGSPHDGDDRLIGGTGWDDHVSSTGNDQLYAREAELRELRFDFDSGKLTLGSLLGKPPEPDTLQCGQHTFARRDLAFDRIATGTCRGVQPPL